MASLKSLASPFGNNMGWGVPKNNSGTTPGYGTNAYGTYSVDSGLTPGASGGSGPSADMGATPALGGGGGMSADRPNVGTMPFARPSSGGYGTNLTSMPAFGGFSGGGYSGTGMVGTPNPSGLTINSTNFRGDPTYGAGQTGWRKYWNGDPFAIQGGAGKENLMAMNKQWQNEIDSTHRAMSDQREANMPAGRVDVSGGGMSGADRLRQILADPQNNDATRNLEQDAAWANNTNIAQIQGYDMSKWSPAQLQAGVQYYKQLQANAVPGSNEWNMYQDYLNAIQDNMAGNRRPVTFPSQSGPGYFNNNAGTPSGGWNTGGGPRS